jgi:hypothetical protein
VMDRRRLCRLCVFTLLHLVISPGHGVCNGVEVMRNETLFF